MRALRVEDIHTYYGLSHVLHGISLEVNESEVVCLLGRNGAGKTTTIRSIMGLNPPAQGQIFIYDQPIQAKKPFDIFKLGIRWIPQGRRIFPMLSVEENLKLALVSSGLKDIQTELDQAYALFTILGERRQARANTLSGNHPTTITISSTSTC